MKTFKDWREYGPLRAAQEKLAGLDSEIQSLDTELSEVRAGRFSENEIGELEVQAVIGRADGREVEKRKAANFDADCSEKVIEGRLSEVRSLRERLALAVPALETEAKEPIGADIRQEHGKYLARLTDAVEEAEKVNAQLVNFEQKAQEVLPGSVGRRCAALTRFLAGQWPLTWKQFRECLEAAEAEVASEGGES